MMQRTKKDKSQKEQRQSLKTYLTVNPHLLTPYIPNGESADSSLLVKLYPKIFQVNALRMISLIEITFITQILLDIVEKMGSIENFKIGIIGGGIMGRLAINSLLVFTKDGLLSKNIMLSTRQTQNFSSYTSNFGIRVLYDNQFIAEQADFLIIATPASLDNWIINDLREPLEKRIQSCGENYFKKQQKDIRSLLGLKKKTIKEQTIPVKNKTTKNEFIPSETIKKNIKPFVYILNSDFNEQKCERLFNFPVVTPTVRATDMKKINQKLKAKIDNQITEEKSIEAYEEVLIELLIEKKEKLKQKENQIILSKEKTSSLNLEQTNFSQIYKALKFVIESSASYPSIQSSFSNSVSVSKPNNASEAQPCILDFLNQGQIQSLFLKNARKYKMAEHNFTS